jgi:hypothetical protein
MRLEYREAHKILRSNDRVRGENLDDAQNAIDVTLALVSLAMTYSPAS